MKKEIPNSVYGPVDSWRLGESLGIDLLCVDSICSFECVYCQLGKINRVTMKRQEFVSTDQVMSNFRESEWESADVVTFSGSGEPTLASNLGEVVQSVKSYSQKPVVVLTNSTLLGSPEVRRDLMDVDKVFCKLDAWSDDLFRRVDRPAPGITLKSIIGGIKDLRRDHDGYIAIQTMLLKSPNESDLKRFAQIIREIGPDEVQLNLPSRPVPAAFSSDYRGNLPTDIEDQSYLKTISSEQLEESTSALSRLTGIRILNRTNASGSNK